MAVANLGRVSFVLQGEYDSAKAYTRLDVVNLNGFAYAAISDVPAGNPPPDTTYWQQMSVQGPEGTPGDPGPAGDSGVEVSTAQPTEEGTNLWINPNAIESISIPEIDDTTTSSEDTWSSQKIAQEIANAGGGGGGESAFELIDTIDWSTAEMAQVNAYKEYTVDNVKEIIFVYNNMKNNTETASTVNAVFNDNYSARTSCAKTGKTSQALNGYVHFKLFENVGLQQYSSGGAVASTNYSNDGTGAYGYNLLPITQPISKINVSNPATQYFATGGTTKMYVR